MYYIHCRCGLTAKVNQEGPTRRQNVTICPRCISRHILIAGAVLGVDWYDSSLISDPKQPVPIVMAEDDDNTKWRVS